ncbi:MAG TPA: iron-sulfur cluster-binding protein [Anaerolineae bacterium]|nr:iron-sulfur cluster-binding protein [Anaerolineae bacterium]
MKTTFYARVRDALNDEQLQNALKIGTGNLVSKRAAAFAKFTEIEDIRDRGRLIRAHTLSQLDGYLAQFANSVEAAGGHVFWAKDAAEANAYVLNLAQAKNVKRVVKSKSMVTEEIKLNHALQEKNIQVVESDLGEFIIQLGNEGPSHIIAPAMHKTRYEVGQIFAEKLKIPYTDDPIELNNIARAHLRQIFLNADMGVSGANFGVAEDGSICLVTNEGNGRLTTTAPRIHVALMGMERIVPTVEDLSVMLQLLGRSATGQKLSVYTNIVAGPRRSDEEDGPEEFHVVILDNGRSNLLGSDLSEMLYCIRCGACLNHCPVYQHIGGHAYGSVYTGPMGSVLTPALQGLDEWSDLPHACSLCGKCKEVCPVRIDLPAMLLKLRNAGNEAGKSPFWLKSGVQFYSALAQRPSLYRTGLKAGGAATRLLASQGWIQKLPGPLSGWTDYRAFPAMAEKSFRQQWEERGSRGVGE